MTLAPAVLAQEVLDSVRSPEVAYAAIAPILIVLGAALAGVLVEAFLPRTSRWAAQVAVSFTGLLVALAAVVLHATAAGREDVSTVGGAVAVDGPALALWTLLLLFGLGSLLLIADRSVEPGGAFVSDVPAGTVVDRVVAGATSTHTEVFPLTLFSLGGMMAFVAADDLLTMFIALEVLSLPLYVLCALARRRRLLSQEAAVKYFLLGAFASAFFLYGLALLYGYAGSVRLSAIADATGGTERSDTLVFAGLGLLLVGLLFKASIAPFHAWTPDVYQGAPTPITGFMAACTKVAAFGAILRILTVAVPGLVYEWRPVLMVVAVISMVVGTVLGLTQNDVKRMIAYSSIAHAGFLLVGTLALTPAGLTGTLFYLLAYGASVLAAVGVISLVRDARGEATHLSSWHGLARRSPLVAAAFAICLLSLAGIPLTSGFIGKFAAFSAAYADGMGVLVVIALVVSAVAAFFYLRVVVVMFFTEPAPDGASVAVPGVFTTTAIALGTAVTVVLGVVPGPVLELLGVGNFVS